MIEFDQVHNKHICPICEQQSMFEYEVDALFTKAVYSHCLNHKFKLAIKSTSYYFEHQRNFINIEFKIESFICNIRLFEKPLKLIIRQPNYSYHKEYMICDLNSVQVDAEIYLLFD